MNSKFIKLALLFTLPINASLYDYIFPYGNPSFSNYGTLGLIQNPNARFYEAGSIAFNWTKAEPYTRGSIVAYPFDWLEATYYYTDINNARYSTSFAFSGNQTYKDKGFEFKARLLKEGRYLPAVAVGARDPAGSGRFAGEYIVSSKRFQNIDFTLGIGWGGLAGNGFKNPLIGLSDRFKIRTREMDTQGGDFNVGSFFSGAQASIFGGIEYTLPNFRGARLKLEYDTTDYEFEGFPFGRDSDRLGLYPVKQPDSDFNVGLLFPISNNFQLSIGFIKGNTFNIGFAMNAPFGRKNPFFKKSDPIKRPDNAKIIKKVNTENEELFTYRTSLNALKENKLALQKASIDGDTMTILYSQATYLSYMQANGRIVDILDEILPDRIKHLELIETNAGLGMFSVSIPREIFKKYQPYESVNLVKSYTEVNPVNLIDKEFKYNPIVPYPAHFWRLTPVLRSQIGGPDGFFFGDLRIGYNSEIQLNKNFSILTDISAGLVDNLGELKLASDSQLPHVRTDIVRYLKESNDIALNRLQANYFGSYSKNIYFKASMGYLESMFSGVGGELLYRPFTKDFAIGIEAWRVRQRDYQMLFDHLDYMTSTGHLNFYYKHPASRILFTLRGGRFLAQDSGFNFDFARVFDNGLRIGAFFSLTDISKKEFGEGSFDKGFYFNIPIQSFFTNYQKGISGFGLRPLTRDGASFLSHGHSLYGITDQAQKFNIDRGWDWLYD